MTFPDPGRVLVTGATGTTGSRPARQLAVPRLPVTFGGTSVRGFGGGTT
jgi:uncharacterized protein YbjT (DUF2867 family)